MSPKQYWIAFGFLLALLCDIIAWYILKMENERFIIFILVLAIGIMFTYYKSKSKGME